MNFSIKTAVWLVSLLFSSLVVAGSLAPPASPQSPDSALYSLLDICRYVADHQVVVAKRTGGFVQPSVGAGTATGCSTDTLMGLLNGQSIAPVDWAGVSTAAASPNAAASARYTLKNICDYLDDSTQQILKRTTFTEPTSAPSATGCSLNDIMGKIQFWAKVSDIAYLAFQAMNPFFNLEKSLNQPNLFFDALAYKHVKGQAKSGTVACPKDGSLAFSFTDVDNDGKYQSKDDQFSVILDTCQDDKLTADGGYVFTLAENVSTAENNGKTVRTDVKTHVQLNELKITTHNETNTLNGKLEAHEQTDIATGKQTIRLRHLDASAPPQVTKPTGDQFSFSALDVVMFKDEASSEKEMYFNGRVVLAASPKAGDYVIETKTDFQLTTYEAYPYVGEIKITATSGANKNLTSTAKVITQADASLPKKVKVTTDANGDGRIDSTKDYLWSELSAQFN